MDFGTYAIVFTCNIPGLAILGTILFLIVQKIRDFANLRNHHKVSCPKCNSKTFRFKREIYNRKTDEKINPYTTITLGILLLLIGGLWLWMGIGLWVGRGGNVYFTDVDLPIFSSPPTITGVGFFTTLIGAGMLLVYFSTARGSRFNISCKNCKHSWHLLIS